MKPYVVQQGDYLAKLAFLMGFDAEPVWGAPENAELRARRRPNILHPGDVLYVPNATAPALALSAGTVNRYTGRIPRTKLRLRLANHGDLMRHERCTVRGLGEPRDLMTDEGGLLEVDIPVNLREVTIFVCRTNTTHRVLVGDMDPIDEATGIAKRLAHLGYYHHGEEETSDQALGASIVRFQQAHGLPRTGTADEATKRALVEAHGS